MGVALEEVWRKVGLFDPARGSLEKFVVGRGWCAMLDACVSGAKAMKRRGVVASAGESDTARLGTVASPPMDAEAELLAAEKERVRSEACARALAKLDADRRDLVRACWIEGTPIAVVAREKGLKRSTLRGRLDAAREQLRRELRRRQVA